MYKVVEVGCSGEELAVVVGPFDVIEGSTVGDTRSVIHGP